MKLLFILLSVLSMNFHASSQNKIEVETGEKVMPQGSYATFNMMIPKSKTKDIENLWKKYVNKRPAGERFNNLTTQVGNIFKSKINQTKRDRLKVDKSGNQLHVRAVDLNEISNYPLDIYASITQSPEGSQLSSFFQYTDSVYIDTTNTNEDKLALIADYVRDFGVEAYKNVVDENIKLANRELSREENVLKNLHASTVRAEKSITRNETLIQQYNSRISVLENDSARMDETIAAKKKEFSEMLKDSADTKPAKTKLKALQKEKARNPIEIRTLKGKIRSKELDIRSAKTQIADNEIEIKTQKTVIDGKQQIAEQLIKEKGEIQ